MLRFPRLLASRLHAAQRRLLTTEHFSGPLSGLDDGSESTLGQDGKYEGEWDAASKRPHGQGVKHGPPTLYFRTHPFAGDGGFTFHLRGGGKQLSLNLN